MAEEHQEELFEASVVTDAQHVRTVADLSTVLYLGRDFELALFAVSPKIRMSLQKGQDGPVAAEALPQYSETVRVRLTPPAAVNLGFNILNALIENKQLDLASFRANVQMIEAKAAETKQ